MRKYRILYLIVIIFVLFCGLWGGRRLAPVILLILVVLPLFSGVRFYLSLGGLSLSFSGEHSCRSGQQPKLTLRLKCNFFRPAGNIRAEIICENSVFGTKEEISCLLEPGKAGEQKYDIPLDTAVCGQRVIRLHEIVCYDLMGLFSSRRIIDEEFVCIVYPYEARMYVSLQRNMEREQPGEIYDGRRSGTDVSEVFGLREYREGDLLQSIHWKLSGKMQQLIVREFGRPVNYHTLVLLSPAFYYNNQEADEEIVNGVFDLGISFSRALIHQNIAHFVGYMSAEEVCCIPIDSLHSYESMLLRLMNHPIQKEGDKTLISFINQQLYRKYTKVVYVTGLVNDAAARNLSVMADLTVLQAVKNESGFLLGGEGYEVVGISVENIREMEHMIPL